LFIRTSFIDVDSQDIIILYTLEKIIKYVHKYLLTYRNNRCILPLNLY
jgi:hypothetical protein